VDIRRLQNVLKNIYITILLVIFGGVVLHAPLSVWLGSAFPDYDLLFKSWKELLIILAGLIVVFLLFKRKQLRLLKEPVIVLAGVYSLLHLLSALFIKNDILSIFAGLLIDLRHVFFFCLVYLAIKMWPSCQKLFIKVAVAGSLVVLIFAMLQVFVLPKDVLKYIGYGKDTIAPYMTVDENSNFVRINSSLRGPNPLGAYAVVALTLAVAYLVKNRLRRNKKVLVVLAVVIIGSLFALWFSYSRSALIAAILSLIVVLVLGVFHKLSKKSLVIISSFAVLMAGIGGLLSLNNNYLISNIMLHENPIGDVSINSNEGHINSLIDGVKSLLRQPFGGGVGSTGSASLYSQNPVIIENQYLFVGHEAGWAGLVVFMIIFGLIMFRLWSLRKSWLALGVFASGLGLAAIGFLLPVWADDTVAIIWWGLAAIATSGRN